MVKTMVVRAGIEVYRQKFLGAISTERNWIMSGIFLQRKLKIDGKQFLTGPRYQGGNINKPFIDIVGMDSDLNHTALELISKEWSQLRAQYVRILVPASPSRRVFLTSIYMPLLFLNPLNSMINLLLCKWRHTKILTGVVRPG